MPQTSVAGIVTVVKTTGAGIVINIPVTAAGTGTLFLESKDIDFGEPARDKYLDLIVFDIETTGSVPTLLVTLGHRNALDTAVIWEAGEYLSLDNPKIKPRLEDRFFTIKLEDENPYSQWKLSKIEAYGRLMGQGRM